MNTEPSAAARPRADSRRLGGRILAMLEQQVAALECEPRADEFSDARVKALQLLSKAIETTEELVRKQEQAHDETDAAPADILEFRRQLERRIAALGEEGIGEGVD